MPRVQNEINKQVITMHTFHNISYLSLRLACELNNRFPMNIFSYSMQLVISFISNYMLTDNEGFHKNKELDILELRKKIGIISKVFNIILPMVSSVTK